MSADQDENTQHQLSWWILITGMIMNILKSQLHIISWFILKCYQVKPSSYKSSCHVDTVNSNLFPEQFVCVLTERQTFISRVLDFSKVKWLQVLVLVVVDEFQDWLWITIILADGSVPRHNPAVCFRELIRCLKWYMDRSAEVVRQDHIQEAMRVRTSAAVCPSQRSSVINIQLL